MKKLILLVCVLCWSYNAKAQCDATLPVFEDFSDSNVVNVCWNLIDGDGDSNNWYWWQYYPPNGEYRVISSNSFYTSSGALTPDNWIISHAIDLRSFSSGNNITLSWKVRGELAGFSHEYYSIYAATNNQTSSFTSSPVKRSEYVDEVGGAGVFVTRTLDLSALAGNMVYIAFRHHNSYDEYNINIDDVAISAGGSSGGCVSDSDNDGVCDPDDQCPGLNDALIGTPCNDGNPCTINDVYDSNCGCSGTFADTDGDGVCDANDRCPGFDDTIDVNGNGIPDGCETESCTEYTANFNTNPLTHSGSGSETTTLTLPSGSQNITFTISGIDDKTNGKESDKFIERVLVTYKDGSGVSRSTGTYQGDQVNSATLNIPDNAQSITISLDDAYDGNSNTTMSVDISPVTYCSTSSPCPDSDGDGVCDTVDQCPGFDDNIDTNGNGVPDGCESGCAEHTGNFSNNPLTHTGSGSNTTTLNLPTNSQDASFTISGLDQKTKGKRGSLYIENVVVTYVDGSGASKEYGTFNGASVSSVSIDILGKVKSITVSLGNFSGTTSSTLSINLSAVTYCGSSSGSSQANTSTKEAGSQQYNSSEQMPSFKIYPNPASSKVYIKVAEINGFKASIALYNMNGILVRSYSMDSKNGLTNELDINGLATGLYVLRINNEEGRLLQTERIVIK